MFVFGLIDIKMKKRYVEKEVRVFIITGLTIDFFKQSNDLIIIFLSIDNKELEKSIKKLFKVYCTLIFFIIKFVYLFCIFF